MPPKRVAPVRARLAKAVRQRRAELRLTQEEAAERSGLSTRYWRAIEGEKPAVSLEILDQMLKGLRWTWVDLAGQLDDRAADDDTPLSLLKSAWRDASPQEQELLTGILRVFSRASLKK